jgi:hypothetical protein
MKKLTIDEIRIAFTQKNWTLKSEKYISSGKILEVICPKGHETTISWNNFQRGQGCKFCAGNIKYDFEYVKKTFQEASCELLEIIYINNMTPMKYRCACGTLSTIRFVDFSAGVRCQTCKGHFNSENFRTKSKDMEIFCEQHGCKFIKSWIQNKRTRIEYICKCGKESEAYWGNFKRYPNCKKCGSAKVSGEKCYMYDPDREAVKLRKKFRKICGQNIYRFMQATNKKKTRSTHELLGYTPQDLQNHILNHPDYEKCKSGVWHVDHIIPIQAFIDHNILDLKIINALENLRPLAGPDNLSKADKYDEAEFKNYLSKIKNI